MTKKFDYVGSAYYEPFMRGRMNQNPATIHVAVFKNMYRRILTELAINRFKWKGLPEEIDPRFLETTLFYNALSVFFFDVNFDKYMAMQATPSGVPNMYNNPTAFTVYGPQFQSKALSAMPRTITVGGEPMRVSEECIPIWANALRIADLDIVTIYSNRLGEADKTIEININNARRTKILSVPENQQLSAINVNRQLDEGQTVIAVSPTAMQDGLIPIALDLGVDMDALEKLQIVRKGIWNECMGLLGIDNANQDKKERLVSSEVDANNDQIANMRYVNLNARKQAAHMINKRWGLNITVDYNSDIDAMVESARSNNSLSEEPI